jgi:uncharacterized protein YkwD
MKKIMIYVVFLVSFALCTTTFAATNARQDTDYSKAILADINAYRLSRGLPALQLDSYLSEIATAHSKNMAENLTSFGHDGFESRMKEAFAHFQQPRGFAENVAYTPAEVTTVVDMWLHSGGHRKNIEGPYNLTGIGIVFDQNGRGYATQVFLATAG